MNFLCEDIDMVAKCQEGNNARHTVQVQEQTQTFYNIITHDVQVSVISNMTSTFCQVG